MALATPTDVERALRRPLTTEESAYVDEPLEVASDLVVGHLHPFPVPTPTPEAVTRVVAEMVAALLNRPPGVMQDVQSTREGPFGTTWVTGSTSLGPYLTDAMKDRLRPFRPSAATISLGSDRS
jgi:hypothetical protein